ncbi:LytR/AlgR family response regulator transcription factor [Flagellimonas aurea]|uniref:LytR/AlgR family response regulator transcription factor n=1 Tax=Flagellimonas aurea TaxID=2915619 RepID=UPI0035CF512B
MNILIIEDEPGTAKDLMETVQSLGPRLKVLDILESVSDGMAWFGMNDHPDVILSDIQLADGLSFELFDQLDLKCPIIFCTAFDEYAIKAFETNGIDYILKPIDRSKLEKSLARYDVLSKHFTRSNTELDQLIKNVHDRLRSYKKSFLVSFQNKMIPVSISEIAFFCTENGSTHLYTLHGKRYSVSYTMEQLEKLLEPKKFFRANRQYIISYHALVSAEPHESRKICIHLLIGTPSAVLVSKKRSPIFLEWLKDR